MVQLTSHSDLGDPAISEFTDGRELVITAHVIAGGIIREEPPERLYQRVDVETEQIAADDRDHQITSRIRVSFYGTRAEQNKENAVPHLFRYGERLRFPAQLNPPRNFRNPGSFDYRAYLAESGITALASVKMNAVELLPGFTGSKTELWRTQIHGSIIEKVHLLWPPAQAGLMDAMVVGEDAFLERPTRVDFQRSGTYHVLVVSGMNLSILALLIFYVLRYLRVSDVLACAITLALSVGYAWLTDVGAPIWRATLMVAVYMGARLLYREKSMLNAVGAAALALVVTNPHTIFGASFQLTFLCVWLIAAVGLPILERTVEPWSRGLRYLHSTSFDFSLAPKIVQLRLDLRMIAGRLQRFFSRSLPLAALSITARNHANRTRVAHGLLLSSGDSRRTAGQPAGGSINRSTHAGSGFRSCSELHVAAPGKNSCVDRCAGLARHCRNRALARWSAHSRPSRSHAHRRHDLQWNGGFGLGNDPGPTANRTCHRGISSSRRKRLLDLRCSAASASPRWNPRSDRD